MRIFFLVFALLLFLLILNGPVKRLARRKGEHARSWELRILISWGFIWVAERFLREVLTRYYPGTAAYHWLLIASAMLASLATYGLFWYLLRRRPDRDYWESKMRSIGSRDEGEEQHHAEK